MWIRRTRRFKISINPSSVSAQSSKPLYVSSIYKKKNEALIRLIHTHTYVSSIHIHTFHQLFTYTDARTDLSVYTHTSRHRRVEHIRDASTLAAAHTYAHVHACVYLTYCTQENATSTTAHTRTQTHTHTDVLTRTTNRSKPSPPPSKTYPPSFQNIAPSPCTWISRSM